MINESCLTIHQRVNGSIRTADLYGFLLQNSKKMLEAHDSFEVNCCSGQEGFDQACDDLICTWFKTYDQSSFFKSDFPEKRLNFNFIRIFVIFHLEMKTIRLFTPILLFLVFFVTACHKGVVKSNNNVTDPLDTQLAVSPAGKFVNNLKEDALNSDIPILKPDSAWEANGLVYFSVFQANTRVRLYYLADDAHKVRRLCYAYSDDGVHFIKPNLGLVFYNGSRNNNILSIYLDGASFFYDKNSEFPFKIIGMSGDFKLHLAYSKDGINFTTDKKPIVDYFADTQNQILYDSEDGKYKFYLRSYVNSQLIKNPLHKSSYYRAVSYLDADSLSEVQITGTPIHHPHLTSAFCISTEYSTILDFDRTKGECDIYKPSIVKYGKNLYFAYASVYHHYAPPPLGNFDNDGYSSIALYISTDGKTFKLYKPNFINQEPISYFMAPGFAVKGEFLYNYYWKVYTTHGNPNRVGEYIARKYTNIQQLADIKRYNNLQ